MDKKLINVIINLEDPESFMSQMPLDDKHIKYHFNNLNKNIVWDFVFFYNIPSEKYEFKVFNGATAFMTGEPKLMLSYSKTFLKQFKYTIAPYKINKKNHYVFSPLVPWFYGYDFTNKKLNYDISVLKEMKPLNKTKVLSVITSKKKFMPGHIKRLNFIIELKKRFFDKIDFYGNNSLKLDDKASGINDYKFHLCFENSSTKDYWTEKLSDPILGFSIPIYYGCKNIEKYFSKGLISIDLDNYEDSINCIKNIIENHETIYYEMLPDLIDNRKKILNELNLFGFFKNTFFEIIENNSREDFEIVKIKDFNSFKANKIINKGLRLKRLFIKFYVDFIYVQSKFLKSL